MWSGQGSDLQSGNIVGRDLVVTDRKKVVSVVVHTEPVLKVVRIQGTKIR